MLEKPKAIIYSAAFMDPELLQLEPHLYKHKWYEYRELTPFECNLEFASAYREAFQTYIHTNVDYRLAKKVPGINLKHWLYPETRRADQAGIKQSVHAARQFADGLGMRYGDFIMFCMEFGGGRRVKHILRPNQLVPRNPDFLTAAEAGRRDIVERTWGRFMENLHHFVEMRGATLEAMARAQGLTNKGKNSPGCFGVVGAYTERTSECKECPVAAKCSAFREMAQAAVERMESSGADTWKMARDRRNRAQRSKTNERVKRHRAKLAQQRDQMSSATAG